MKQTKKSQINHKLILAIIGIVLIFGGVIFGGAAYLLHWDSGFVLLGTITAAAGLFIMASPQAWTNAFIALINS